MQNDSSNYTNPWLEIPLADYERHMLHESVGQLQLLNSLTKKYLSLIQPVTCFFMGVAGGNGLEHIDNTKTKHVFGIDINLEYLESCRNRFKDKIDQLTLSRLDITENSSRICQADFIWAALVLEYAGIEKSFEFANNNIIPGGHFIVTIQSNNNLQAVSPTGVESIKKVGSISNPVYREEMLQIANQFGNELFSKEENNLPNGKTFLTYHFVHK